MSRRLALDGHVALVTGAGRGLGRAYARALAARGAAVVVHDAGVEADGSGGDPGIAEAVAAEIRAADGTALADSSNLGTREGCEQAVRAALERFGRLDALVSNAGLVHFGAIEETEAETYERQRRVNLDASFYLAKAAFPVMRRAGYGRIVLTTSGRALRIEAAVPGLSTYAAAKLGVVGLAIALAVEGAEAGILVNAVSPVAATRMLRRSVEPGELEPEQVAPGIVFLASPLCEVTGVVLQASGGRFAVGRFAFSEGVDFGREPVQPEAIAARWAEIAGG